MAKLAGLVNGIFLSKTKVQSVERLSPHYFRVTTDALTFAPGDKAQIRVADWGMRTYTPF